MTTDAPNSSEEVLERLKELRPVAEQMRTNVAMIIHAPSSVHPGLEMIDGQLGTIAAAGRMVELDHKFPATLRDDLLNAQEHLHGQSQLLQYVTTKHGYTTTQVAAAKEVMDKVDEDIMPVLNSSHFAGAVKANTHALPTELDAPDELPAEKLKGGVKATGARKANARSRGTTKTSEGNNDTRNAS